jgi:hypothetical protein
MKFSVQTLCSPSTSRRYCPNCIVKFNGKCAKHVQNIRNYMNIKKKEIFDSISNSVSMRVFESGMLRRIS